MTRVATIPLQRMMSAAIQHSQQGLAETQMQLATEKKANDYASLGADAVRNLSSHTLLAQQTAYVAVASRAGTTMSLYNANLEAIDTSVSAMRQDILIAIGTGKTNSLSDSIQSAFDQFRSALNASEGGLTLFGGSQTDRPAFGPSTLADTIGVPAASAFASDDIKASVRLSDRVETQYGVTAHDVGTGLYAAFQTLAAAGTIGDTPTPSQLDALQQAMGQLETGLTQMRTVSATNGRNQAQAETLATRAGDRGVLLSGIISDTEDADLGQLAINLAQQKTILQASYSVFSQLSGMSLVDYLG